MVGMIPQIGFLTIVLIYINLAVKHKMVLTWYFWMFTIMFFVAATFWGFKDYYNEQGLYLETMINIERNYGPFFYQLDIFKSASKNKVLLVVVLFSIFLLFFISLIFLAEHKIKNRRSFGLIVNNIH